MLTRVSEGDTDAFREFFQANKDEVYQSAMRFTQSPELAEEVVQDVFLAIWLKKHTIPDIDNLKNYLFITTRNAVFRAFRIIAERELRERQYIADQQNSTSYDSARILLGNKYDNLLKEAIARLPIQQKTVYTLIKEQDFSREDVARKLNLSPETVKRHLSLATKSIRAFCLRHIYLLFLTACHYL